MRYVLIALAACLIAPAYAQSLTPDDLERAANECNKQAIPGPGRRVYKPGYEACTHIFELWGPIVQERRRLEDERKERDMRNLINRFGK